MLSHELVLPKELLSKYKFIREYSQGGSTGRVFLVRNQGQLVLKYASIEGIGFNGKPWNKQQYLKLAELQKILPARSAKLFPKVFEFFETAHYNYYTMEYFRGSPIPNYFLKKPAEIMPLMGQLLELLVSRLYSLGVRLGPSKYVSENHFNRVVHRINLLNRRKGYVYDSFIKDRNVVIANEKYDDLTYFFERLFMPEVININNRYYLNMPRLINLLEANIALLNKSLSPTYLPTYVHGDLLLRNILLNRKGEIKLIDVRGENVNERIPSLISLEYEIGKMYHSFLLELIRRNYLIAKIQTYEKGFGFYLSFKKDKRVTAFLEARRSMPVLIKQFFYNTVFWEDEAKFTYNILLSEAAHFAADAVNRLAQDPSGHHTILYYISSVILFNDLLSQLGLTTNTWADTSPLGL